MPFASSDDTVIEETYAYLATLGVPSRVRKTLPPTVKPRFVIVLCEPVQRIYSEFEYNTKMRQIILENYSSFDEFIRFGVKEVHSALENLGRHDTRKGKAKLMNYIKTLDKSMTPELSLITNGIYHLLLFEWIEVFSKNDFFLVNANAFETNPVEEMYYLEDFLMLRPWFEDSKLTYSEENGLWCYSAFTYNCAR